MVYRLITFILLALVFVGNSNAHDSMFKGILIWGSEVEIFRPCDGTEERWVSYGWAGIEMIEYYKEKQSEPYQSMYIEFRGHTLDEKLGGYAVDYAGLIRLSEVFTYTFEIPQTCKANQ